VPEALITKRVISLDMGSLVSGTRFRGDFEERLTQLVEEVRQDPDMILVIDEIHTLMGAGSTGDGPQDAANELKAAMSRGVEISMSAPAEEPTVKNGPLICGL